MAVVQIRYSLSRKGQKFLIAQGKPANDAQVYDLDDPQNKLLELAFVDSKGKLSLDIDNYLKHWHVKSTHAQTFPNIYVDGMGWQFRHTFQLDSYTSSDYNLDTPINTVDGVLAVIAANNARKQAVADTIPALEADDANQYKDACAKFAEQERVNALRAEVRKELETSYQEPSRKINTIAELIEGKTRVRTAQIRAILDT
jgi:hypothetical protein